jgi:tetratricopeptide (TPR) repeat protein
MNPLPNFLKRFFSREQPPEPGSITEELWVADLSGTSEKGRFLECEEESHGASYREGGLGLRLKRPGLFAWTEAPLYRQSDFVLEGEFAFANGVPLGGSAAEGQPYSACGFLFRAADEGNFYCVLVSNKGYLRMDAVFNGKPRPLFAWTECPVELGSSFSLRVIARGNHFIVLVDDEWAAEAFDDTFRAGYPGFAAQNYGPAEGEEGAGGAAEFLLESCFIESRPVEVETWYYRYNYFEVASPEARIRLAETFFAMGEWLSASAQLRKAEGRRPLTAGELFLKAELLIRLELYDEAGEALEACLAAEPGKKEAVEEKANLLYLKASYLELRDYVDGLLGTDPGSPRLRTLAGHARFSLGDYIGAAEDYAHAAALDPAQPLFRMNEARAREQAGDKRGAARAYLEAARGFFTAEADDDLELALARLGELDPRNPELAATRAKLLYRRGRKLEAKAAIAGLIKAGTQDSAIHYLAGLIANEEGQREKALGHFEAATALEPGYPLYAFRRAEYIFLLGRPEAGEAIGRALELAPEDGWICNLAGQFWLAKRPLVEEAAGRAREFLERARAALPGSVEPAVNLAELESLLGHEERALAELAAFPDEPQARNQAGNVLARSGKIEEAAREYEKAIAACANAKHAASGSSLPSLGEYEANLAAAYFELERYSEAEERIRKALDLGAGPRVYLLAGNLALVYGDWVRAETSYRAGLELDPESAELLFALGRCYVGARKQAKAEDCVERLEKLDSGRAARLKAELLEALTELISCSSCGRSWRLPRDIPAQSGASIRGMPPDDSPAGSCPRCGKVFCIACRKDALVDNRFTCPDCGESLKLSDNRLRYLVREALKR